MIPLSARDLRYIGPATKSTETDEEYEARIKRIHDWLRSFAPDNLKDAPIRRVRIDENYKPVLEYEQDYTRRRKKTVSE